MKEAEQAAKESNDLLQGQNQVLKLIAQGEPLQPRLRRQGSASVSNSKQPIIAWPKPAEVSEWGAPARYRIESSRSRQRRKSSDRSFVEPCISLPIGFRKSNPIPLHTSSLTFKFYRIIEAAAQNYKYALAVYERTTSDLGGADNDRARFRAKQTVVYQEHSALLLQDRQPASAFDVLERPRAHTYWRCCRGVKTIFAKQQSPRCGRLLRA